VTCKEDILTSLLRGKARVDEKDGDGQSALFLAAARDELGIVKQLLAARACPNAMDRAGFTILHRSCHNSSIVCDLLRSRANPNTPTRGSENKMVLHVAAEQGSAPVVKALVSARAAVNAVCQGTNCMYVSGYTALHYAALSGSAEVTQTLLNVKANLFAVDEHGSTALHLAASVCVVRVLLDAGLDMNTLDSLGNTPWSNAAKCGREGIFTMLVDAHANLNIADKAGWSQLHRAARNGHSKMLSQLLSARAEVNLRTADDEGGTALHLAANVDVARELLEAHADVNMVSKRGDTTLHCARSPGVVEVLLQAGANPSVKNILGETVFHRFRGQKCVTKCLLSARADVKSAGPTYCASTMWLASHDNDADLAKLLLEAGMDLKSASSKVNDLMSHHKLMTSLQRLAHNNEELEGLLAKHLPHIKGNRQESLRGSTPAGPNRSSRSSLPRTPSSSRSSSGSSPKEIAKSHLRSSSRSHLVSVGQLSVTSMKGSIT